MRLKLSIQRDHDCHLPALSVRIMCASEGMGLSGKTEGRNMHWAPIARIARISCYLVMAVSYGLPLVRNKPSQTQWLKTRSLKQCRFLTYGVSRELLLASAELCKGVG